MNDLIGRHGFIRAGGNWLRS